MRVTFNRSPAACSCQPLRHAAVGRPLENSPQVGGWRTPDITDSPSRRLLQSRGRRSAACHRPARGPSIGRSPATLAAAFPPPQATSSRSPAACSRRPLRREAGDCPPEGAASRPPPSSRTSPTGEAAVSGHPKVGPLLGARPPAVCQRPARGILSGSAGNVRPSLAAHSCRPLGTGGRRPAASWWCARGGLSGWRRLATHRRPVCGLFGGQRPAAYRLPARTAYPAGDVRPFVGGRSWRRLRRATFGRSLAARWRRPLWRATLTRVDRPLQRRLATRRQPTRSGLTGEWPEVTRGRVHRERAAGNVRPAARRRLVLLAGDAFHLPAASSRRPLRRATSRHSLAAR